MTDLLDDPDTPPSHEGSLFLNYDGSLLNSDPGHICDECGNPHVVACCCDCGLHLCASHDGCPDCESDEHLVNVLPLEHEPRYPSPRKQRRRRA